MSKVEHRNGVTQKLSQKSCSVFHLSLKKKTFLLHQTIIVLTMFCFYELCFMFAFYSYFSLCPSSAYHQVVHWWKICRIQEFRMVGHSQSCKFILY